MYISSFFCAANIIQLPILLILSTVYLAVVYVVRVHRFQCIAYELHCADVPRWVMHFVSGVQSTPRNTQLRIPFAKCVTAMLASCAEGV